jgi:hypothetical protein
MWDNTAVWDTTLCVEVAQVYVKIQSDDILLPPHKELCPYYIVIPPYTELCPLLQCYPYMNSYAPYCSVKPPHKELFPLL